MIVARVQCDRGAVIRESFDRILFEICHDPSGDPVHNRGADIVLVVGRESATSSHSKALSANHGIDERQHCLEEKPFDRVTPVLAGCVHDRR
jgi:hypothetical protein